MTSDVLSERRRAVASTKLEFRLLGELTVLADGRVVDLGGTRQRSVLAILLLQRGHAITTELMADRLWQGEQPASAIKTIQAYVARIRHALGRDAHRLVSTATGYRLVVSDDELDATRFERGLRQAREMLASGSADAALPGFEEILSLWSGPALADLAGETFAHREADRLDELRVQAFEELYDLRIATGSGREVIGEIRHLLADQPGRERLWRLLMLALYADGRQGEALQAYQEARRYLAEELGLDPSPALQAFERAILTQEAPVPPPRVSSAASGEEALRHASRADASAAEPEHRQTRRVVTLLRANHSQTSTDTLDPEILDARARRVADIVGRAVERHGGTIDQADHDGLTAVFGLNAAREDDALRAVRAAFELIGASTELASSDDTVFRLGIATGEVLAGGSGLRGRTLAGMPFQVVARLAAAAGPLEILLAPETANLVQGATTSELVPQVPGDDSTPASAVRVLGLTSADPIVRQTTTPFVGRNRELGALTATFERVVAEAMPRAITVIGAPGVGKSRLVAEAFARITQRAWILRSRCLPYGDGITYWPIRDLVLAACGIGPDDAREVARARLARALSGMVGVDQVRNGVASVLGLVDEPVPAEEIRWACRRFFEGLAADRPLVLLVDDLQWAEPVLVDVLEHLLDLGRGSVMLVTVARPELLDTRPEWLARAGLELIRLEPLDDTDAATLLDHLAPNLPEGPLRSRILATAEGNPLFVEQFVAYAADEAGDNDRGLDARTAADLRVPPTIGALLAARLDRLPGSERHLLEEAAVMGRTFWAGVLAEHRSEAERAALPGQLARLSHRDLIRPERSDVQGDEAYRFRHLLIRDAAYASLPKRDRAELHERVANWLEVRAGSPGHDDLIVGYHLEQGYRYRIQLGDDPSDARHLADRALQVIGPAGQAAEERYDVHAAISLLNRALDLAPRGRERIGLLISLRAALRMAGETEASAAALAETDALLTEFPDEGLEYRHQLTEVTLNWSPYGTLPDAKAAYAFYERVGDGMGMVRAMEFMVFTFDGPFTDGIELLEEAVALAMKLGRPDRAATLNARLAWQFYYSPMPVPDVLVRLRRSLEQAGENGFSRSVILMELGRFEAMTDVGDGWRRHFEEAKVLIDDLGLLIPIGAAGYPKKLGATEVACGDPARVLDMLEESCATLARLGGDMVGHLATLAATTAEAFMAVGRLADAERYAGWARDIADTSDEQADWRIAMSLVRSMQERHDEAVTLAREALSLASSEFGSDLVDMRRAHMSVAKALSGAGDGAASMAAAREARQLAVAKQDRAALRRIDVFLSE